MKYRRWAGLALFLALLLVGPAANGFLDRFGGSSQERILEADQAFQLTVSAVDPLTVEARWLIAPGYYLYRDKFRLELLDAQASPSAPRKSRRANSRTTRFSARSTSSTTRQWRPPACNVNRPTRSPCG